MTGLTGYLYALLIIEKGFCSTYPEDERFSPIITALTDTISATVKQISDLCLHKADELIVT